MCSVNGKRSQSDPIESRGQEPSAPSELAELGGGEASAGFDNRKIVSFEELAGGQKTVIIDFHGQHYRLRLTKSGRLVLTK